MSTPSGGRVRATSARLPPLDDVGRHALWPAVKPQRGRRRADAAPAGRTRGLRGLRGGLDLDRHPWPDDLGFPLPWRPQEAVPQEIEVRAAKHLPLQHFEAVDMALDRPITPGQRDARFDGLIVVVEPGGEASQGLQGTAAARCSQGSSCAGCRWRTRVVKSSARSIASATSADCARSWVSCWASSAVRWASRRRTSQVARRGVRAGTWAPPPRAGSGAGPGVGGASPGPGGGGWHRRRHGDSSRVALGLELPKQLDGRPAAGIPALQEIAL